jgi:hypothetical protein
MSKARQTFLLLSNSVQCTELEVQELEGGQSQPYYAVGSVSTQKAGSPAGPQGELRLIHGINRAVLGITQLRSLGRRPELFTFPAPRPRQIKGPPTRAGVNKLALDRLCLKKTRQTSPRSQFSPHSVGEISQSET